MRAFSQEGQYPLCVFGGAVARGIASLRLKVRDYSGGGLSALRVISSPPESGGVRGGLNVGYNYRGLLHRPFFRPPRPSGSPPNSGGEEVTLMTND